MQAMYPIKTSFSAGQLSRKLFGRVDVEVYTAGLESMLNFIPDSRGPARKRPGFEYIEQVTASTNPGARVFVRQKSQDVFYIMTFTHNSVRITTHNSANPSTVAASQAIATTYAAADLDQLYLVPVPENLTVYLLHPDKPVRKLALSGTWSLSTPVITSEPAEWNPEYPSVGTFYQGRLWVSGVSTSPEYLWASKTSSYEDFSLGAAAATDAIAKVVNAMGAIRWMMAQNVLLIGTEFGEHTVAADSGVITPTDILIKQQSSYGGAQIEPAMMGDQVAYVSASRDKLYTINYQFQENSWLSRDLAFYSDDLMVEDVKAIAWNPNPDNLMWCLLEDGTMSLLVYERSKDKSGWAVHTHFDGVTDIAPVLVNGVSHLVIVTNRDTLDYDIQISNPAIYMDDAEIITSGMPTSTVTGLGRFEGEDVDLLVDGAIQASKTVTGGQVTLDLEATSEIVVGKSYLASFKTLPLDVVAGGDSKMAYKKRFANLYLRMYDSGVPIVNGVAVADRTPATPMGSPEPLTTGDVKYVLLGRDRFAQVEVQQSLPLPCNVVALFGKVGASSV